MASSTLGASSMYVQAMVVLGNDIGKKKDATKAKKAQVVDDDAADGVYKEAYLHVISERNSYVDNEKVQSPANTMDSSTKSRVLKKEWREGGHWRIAPGS